MAENERIYTIPLGDAYEHSRRSRAAKAAKLVRAFLCRHMKADAESVRISQGTNSAILARGMQKPPRKIKVRVVRADGLVTAYLMDEKLPEKKEAKKEKGEKKVEKPGEKEAREEKAPEKKAEGGKEAHGQEKKG